MEEEKMKHVTTYLQRLKQDSIIYVFIIITFLLAGCAAPLEVDETIEETEIIEISADEVEDIEETEIIEISETEVEELEVPDANSNLEEEKSIDNIEENEESVSTIEQKDKIVIKNTEADYEIITAIYEQGKIKIEYPQITGLLDEQKQEKINELIRDDLLETQVYEVLEHLDLENEYCEEIYHLELKYEIKAQTAEILSILYTGDSLIETLYNEYYSTYYSYDVDALTLSIEEAKKLELADFVDVNEELVKRIKECTNYTNPTVKTQKDKEGLKIVIQEADEEFIIRGLSKCYGSYQFCVTPDELIISIETVHAGGDYILFTLQNVLKTEHDT